MQFTNGDLESYMGRAINLAKLAPEGVRTPYVGALVLGQNGEIVGEGYKSFEMGGILLIHAERMALEQAGDSAKDGSLITTLEPCMSGINQIVVPCSELIVRSGVQLVVIGLIDDALQMKGQAVRYLERHGVQVVRYRGMNYSIARELMPKKYKAPKRYRR